MKTKLIFALMLISGAFAMTSCGSSNDGEDYDSTAVYESESYDINDAEGDYD